MSIKERITQIRNNIKQSIEIASPKILNAGKLLLDFLRGTPTATIYAGAMIITASIIGNYYLAAHEDNSQISVTGYARQEIQSDVATLSLTFSTYVSTNNKEADVKGFNSIIKSAIAKLKGMGYTDKDISVLPMSNSADNQYIESSGQTITRGYWYSQIIKINSKNIDQLESISRIPSDYFGDMNAAIAVNMEYYIENLAELKHDLISAATKDAVKRAKIIAKQTSNMIGSIRSADIGVFQITQPHSQETSDYGIYDTSTRTKNVSITVNAHFEIN